MENLTPSDHGSLGAYEQHPQCAWSSRGIRPKVRRRLEAIASRALAVRPGPKTGDDDLRSNQPKTEISCTGYIAGFAPVAEPFDGVANVYPTISRGNSFRRAPFCELSSEDRRRLARPEPKSEPKRRWRIASNA